MTASHWVRGRVWRPKAAIRTGGGGWADSLPVGMLAGKAPPGHRARKHVALEGNTLDETAALVEAAGGWVDGETLRSESVGGHRRTQHVEQVTWWVMPDSAFDD